MNARPYTCVRAVLVPPRCLPYLFDKRHRLQRLAVRVKRRKRELLYVSQTLAAGPRLVQKLPYPSEPVRVEERHEVRQRRHIERAIEHYLRAARSKGYGSLQHSPSSTAIAAACTADAAATRGMSEHGYFFPSRPGSARLTNCTFVVMPLAEAERRTSRYHSSRFDAPRSSLRSRTLKNNKTSCYWLTRI